MCCVLCVQARLRQLEEQDQSEDTLMGLAKQAAAAGAATAGVMPEQLSLEEAKVGVPLYQLLCIAIFWKPSFPLLSKFGLCFVCTHHTVRQQGRANPLSLSN